MRVPSEGGCACGAVRYRLASDPLFRHCFHCLNCQRQTGSAFPWRGFSTCRRASSDGRPKVAAPRARKHLPVAAGDPAEAPSAELPVTP